jgi:polysaccharide biosynthesis transport protein
LAVQRTFKTASFRDFLRIFSQRKEVILVPFLIITGLFLVVSLMAPATYQSASKILVKERRAVNPVQHSKFFMDYRTERVTFLQAQMEIIQSDEVSRRVLGKLDPGQKGSSPNQIKYFKGRIKVFSPEGYDLTNSDVLLVRVTANHPEKAAKEADLLTEEYIQYTHEFKGRADKQSVDFLENQVQIQLEKMRQAEDQIKTFEKGSGPELTFLKATCQSKGVKADLISLNHDFLNAKTALKEIESFLGQLKTMVQRGMIPPQMFRENPILAGIKEHLIQLEGQLAGLQTRYGEACLKKTMIIKEIERNQQILNQEVTADLKGRLAEMAALEARLKSLKEIVDRYNRLAQKQLDYSKLYGAYEILEEGYQDLLRDLQQARFAQAMDNYKLASIEIIDRAQVPKNPVSPNILYNTLVGGAIGILVGLGSALVFWYFEQTFKSAEDVEHHLNMQVLGSVPRR